MMGAPGESGYWSRAKHPRFFCGSHISVDSWNFRLLPSIEVAYVPAVFDGWYIEVGWAWFYVSVRVG